MPLDPEGASRPVVLQLFADDPADLDAKPEMIEAHRELVRQADRLFGARHFRHYDLMLEQSKLVGDIGLEHHESSENGVMPGYFKDWDKGIKARELLPHEYVHSWNGKFRRPADLWTPNLNVPMRDSLLWVYEGQTQYWGYVLAARAGLVNAERVARPLRPHGRLPRGDGRPQLAQPAGHDQRSADRRAAAAARGTTSSAASTTTTRWCWSGSTSTRASASGAATRARSTTSRAPSSALRTGASRR